MASPKRKREYSEEEKADRARQMREYRARLKAEKEAREQAEKEAREQAAEAKRALQREQSRIRMQRLRSNKKAAPTKQQAAMAPASNQDGTEKTPPSGVGETPGPPSPVRSTERFNETDSPMEEDAVDDQSDIENMDLVITDPAERAAFYNFMATANTEDSNNTAVASREIGSASRVASREIGANNRAASRDIVELENKRAARAEKRTAAVLKVASSKKHKRNMASSRRNNALPFHHPMRSLTSNTDTPQAPTNRDDATTARASDAVVGDDTLEDDNACALQDSNTGNDTDTPAGDSTPERKTSNPKTNPTPDSEQKLPAREGPNPEDNFGGFDFGSSWNSTGAVETGIGPGGFQFAGMDGSLAVSSGSLFAQRPSSRANKPPPPPRAEKLPPTPAPHAKKPPSTSAPQTKRSRKKKSTTPAAPTRFSMRIREQAVQRHNDQHDDMFDVWGDELGAELVDNDDEQLAEEQQPWVCPMCHHVNPYEESYCLMQVQEPELHRPPSTWANWTGVDISAPKCPVCSTPMPGNATKCAACQYDMSSRGDQNEE